MGKRKGSVMIDVKVAVKTAREYAENLLGELPNLELEEVELTEDERYWRVTFGFDGTPAPVYAGLGDKAPRSRKYKIFNVKTDDGTVRSMKIRETQ